VTGRALFAGDVSFDTTMRVDRIPGPDEKVHVDSLSEAPGGVIANAAVAACRAGAAVRALLHFGDDLASRAAPSLLTERGLELDISTGRGALCRCVIIIDRSGEKRLLLHPGVSMYPTAEQAQRAPLAGAGWMHTAIYDPLAASILIARCRELSIPFSIDLEPATLVHGIESLAGHIEGAAVVFCNVRSAAILGADAVPRLEKLGAKAIVLTQGPAGATWHSAGHSFSVSAPAVSVIDTTGAGDCLAGWFIAETLRGKGSGPALCAAVAAASWSCARIGAQDSFPCRDDIVLLLEHAEAESI